MSGGLNLAVIFDELNSLKTAYGPRFLIGLSGGGDSMALAHVCAVWKRQSGADVRALVVDHGLRPEAGNEALHVRSWAQKLDLNTKVHTYQGPIFTTRIQENARNLRHVAFAETVAEMGGATVLLGHTLDDQAETIAFRLARQTGLDGLAGMAKIANNVIENVVIARPLLEVRRESLRMYLREVGQDWIEDPSNQNAAFSRVRVRNRLAQLGGHETLATIGAHASLLRAAQDDLAADLARRCNVAKDDSATRFFAAPFQKSLPFIQARFLATLMGSKRPIDMRKLTDLAAKMMLPNFRSATLANQIIQRRTDTFEVSLAPERRRKQ